jgi:hypothetical protein
MIVTFGCSVADGSALGLAVGLAVAGADTPLCAAVPEQATTIPANASDTRRPPIFLTTPR